MSSNSMPGGLKPLQARLALHFLDLRRRLALGGALADSAVLLDDLFVVLTHILLDDSNFLVTENGHDVADFVVAEVLLNVGEKVLHRDPAGRELRTAAPVNDVDGFSSHAYFPRMANLLRVTLS